MLRRPLTDHVATSRRLKFADSLNALRAEGVPVWKSVDTVLVYGAVLMTHHVSSCSLTRSALLRVYYRSDINNFDAVVQSVQRSMPPGELCLT